MLLLEVLPEKEVEKREQPAFTCDPLAMSWPAFLPAIVRNLANYFPSLLQNFP